jgi:hypothetical protein
MHLIDLYRLEATGGRVLEHYRVLTARADASAHESPDSLAKAAFELAWQTDPQALIAAIEAEVAAPEDAAPARRRSRPSASEKGEAS